MDAECEELGLNEAECAEYHERQRVGGTGETGKWQLKQREDGTYFRFNPETGEVQPVDVSVLPDPVQELEDDLVGLTPVVEPDPRTTPGTPSSIAKPGLETPYYQDAYGELYDRGGNPITEAQRKRLLGSISGTDPYAAAADARDAQRLAEQIRAQRIREAQDAADAIQQRLQAAQAARLEGARFAVTPSMGNGYFPGLGPSSPIVRQGLADPFQYQPIGFNPERGVDINEQQIARDLQMIRAAAGQGA